MASFTTNPSTTAGYTYVGRYVSLTAKIVLVGHPTTVDGNAVMLPEEMLAVQDRSPAGSTDSACILLRSRLDLANAFDLLLFEDLFQTAMALPVAADVVMSPSSEDVDVEMDAAAP